MDLLFNNIIENNEFFWLLITDKNKKIIYVNKTVEKISGYSKEALIEKVHKYFLPQKKIN